MKKLTNYSIVLLLFALVSCKHKAGYFHLDPELRSWFNYKAGSYWVFKDSATKGLDSSWVVSRQDVINSLSHNADYEAVEIIMREKCSYPKDSTDGWHIYVKAYDEYYPEGCVHMSCIGNYYYPVFTKAENHRGITGSNDTFDVNMLPSLVVNNHTFRDVYHIRFHRLDEHFYLNKDAGLIKIVQHNSKYHRTLELMRWKVVR